MEKIQIILYSIAFISLISIIIILIITSKQEKKKIIKFYDRYFARYNHVKTMPIPYKMTKAHAIIAKNPDSENKIDEYYKLYEEILQDLDKVNDVLIECQEFVRINKLKKIKPLLIEIDPLLRKCEYSINVVNDYAEQFSLKEEEKRQARLKLQEKYRKLQLFIEDNAKHFSFAYEGLLERHKQCGNLFSLAEQYMFGIDLKKVDECHEEIEKTMLDIAQDIKLIPELIELVSIKCSDCLQELIRNFELSKTKGTFLKHLKIDETIEQLSSDLNICKARLKQGYAGDIIDKAKNIVVTSDNIQQQLANEVSANDFIRQEISTCQKDINELNKNIEYIKKVSDLKQEKYDISVDFDTISTIEENIKQYNIHKNTLLNDLNKSLKPSSEILDEIKTLHEDVKVNLSYTVEQKDKFEKTSQDEKKAQENILQWQLILSDIEAKVHEYKLPVISHIFYDDLKVCKSKILQIENLLEEVPLRIDVINQELKETIDFVSMFYNNINNIISTVIKVEDALIFGNRYRSTYLNVDNELSRVEISFLNGEYTSSLKTITQVLEKLFPNGSDTNVMENI